MKKKIKNLPVDLPVYLVTDKNPDNWDEDNERWREAYPLVYVNRERHYGDGFEADEYNIILETEEP